MDTDDEYLAAEQEQRDDWSSFVRDALRNGYSMPTTTAYDDFTQKERDSLVSDVEEWKKRQQRKEREETERKQQEVVDKFHAEQTCTKVESFNSEHFEASRLGYPSMPRSRHFHDLTAEEVHAFKNGFNHWRVARSKMLMVATEAKEAGYGIPDNFTGLTIEQQGSVIASYKHWKEERQQQIKTFVAAASEAGFQLDDNVADLTYAEQESLYSQFEEWNRAREEGTLTIAPLIPLPSAGETLNKATREAEDNRRAGFKTTVDSEATRQGRAVAQGARGTAKREAKLKSLRATDKNQLTSDGGSAAPQPPVRRTSSRARRPSQKKMDSHGEPQLHSVDSFDAKVDHLTNEFHDDIVAPWEQLLSNLDSNAGKEGFSS